MSAVGQAGRPREARLDQAIMDATRELVLERGYNGASLAAVTSRAGTNTAAIYRRWSSKAELVMQTVFGTDGRDVVSDTGDLEADVAAMVRWTLEKLGSPTGQAALAGLLGENREGRAALGEQLRAVQAMVGERLARAVDAGELADDIDVAVQVAALVGPAMQVAITYGERAVDEANVAALTRVALRGLGHRGKRPAKGRG
jgi:AcrR family transcriptional regulator